MNTNEFTIRDYHPSDLPSLYRICLETGQDGADATGTVDAELLGHFFAAPYAVFAPDLCSILTMAGLPVGYILGTSDSKAFADECEATWWPQLRARYALPADTDSSRSATLIRSIHEGYQPPSITQDYPAHLHIDLLPPAQGKGFGRVLIERFEAQLRNRGVPGLHFGVSARNARALGFYRRLGFETLFENSEGILFGRSLG